MEETKKTQSPMAWVLGQTGDHGGQYILSVVLAIIGVAFSLAPYFVVIGVVQGLMDGVKDFSFYLSRCLIMAAFWLGRVLFHALSTATSHKATFAVLGEIRKRCMEKLTRLPLGTVLEQSSGALKNTLIERIDSIETTLAHIVPEFTANLLILIIILVYIFTLDWRMGLASLATVPLGMFCYVFMMLQTEAGYDTCAKKRVEIAEHMRYLPMGYFNENSLGQITSVTTNVMESLENVATRVVMLVCEGLLTTSLIIVMLFFFDWRIALVLLGGFALFLLANRFLQKAAGGLAPRKIAADEKLVEKVLEYLQGMAEVKAYHLSGQKSRELNNAIAENVKINTDMEMTLIPRMTAQSFLAKLTGVCMVGFSCAFYCAGTMDALTAVVMVISAFIVYASLETAGNYSALLRVVEVSVQRAQEILDTPQMDITGEAIAPETRELRADEVEFSYEKRKVIDGVTVQIPEKTTTAIVGPSGGGKTTLVNLLARFWDVDAGSVALGGRNVKDYDMDSLMANFSFVFQNVYLFHDTIANNIRFGQPEASMDAVIEAAKKACCHDFIMALPEGYDTIIGEGGASLSGGEKQRISIARAMMKDAPVIFLDEATANVDPENENELMRAIQALTAEKTVIMIAHRLKTVERADQILVIDHGRIVQQGNHESLMAEEGIYKTFIGERREAASWKVRT